VIRIPCPYCGDRNSSEFHYVGEGAARPDAASVAIEDWRAYLYTRRNPAGWTTETWFHGSGCRSYLRVQRHSVTNEISQVTPLRDLVREEPERPQ
jgi:heterotetrameric sarcosine oxidase delta subunit